MCPQSQHLAVLAPHADPFAGSSYGGDDERGTKEGQHRRCSSHEQQVVLTVLANLVLQRAVLGKDKTPSVELLLLCAGGDTPYPHRAVFVAGDQCLCIHVLDICDRAPEKIF